MTTTRYQPPTTEAPDVRQALGQVARVIDANNTPPQFKQEIASIVNIAPGEFKRLHPLTSGMSVVLQPASATNFGQRVTLLIEGALGACTIKPVTGTIDGSASYTLAAGYTTFLTLVSNGDGVWLSARAASYPTAGNALTYSTDTLNYTGSTTNVNSATTAGDLNVVDISTLGCGGTLSFQSLTEANIDGFTAKTDGFWFVLYVRDATTSESLTLTDNNGNTTTSIRTPNVRGWRLTKNDAVFLVYSNSRWRVVSSYQKLYVTPVDSVTWATQQDNYQRTQRNTAGLRVTLTGNQTLTGVVPDTVEPSGELLFIENVDTADSLTIPHDSTSSTADNRFLMPDGYALVLEPRTGALCRYDGTSSRWRLVSTSARGQARAEGVRTSNTTATAATTDLTVTSGTIPANSMSAGTVYRLTGYYVFVHTAAATPTLTAELLINGSAVETVVLTPVATAATYSGQLTATITCRTTGGSGTVMCTLMNESNAGATAVSEQIGSTATGTDTVDTTVDRSFELRIRMTTGVASNALTVIQGMTERFN